MNIQMVRNCQIYFDNIFLKDFELFSGQMSLVLGVAKGRVKNEKCAFCCYSVFHAKI